MDHAPAGQIGQKLSSWYPPKHAEPVTAATLIAAGAEVELTSSGEATTHMSSTTSITDEERERLAMRRRAALRQAVWDASQSMGTDEIANFVGKVMHEIDAGAA